MENYYTGIELTGLALAVSSRWQSVEECADQGAAEEGFKLDKFKKTTGVNGRYIADEYQTTADFCCAAAQKVLEKFSADKSEIGILLLVTQYPDYTSPATACVLQHRLGLSQNCMAFDVNQGCAGFVYGLNIACALLASSGCTKALMLCGDTSVKNKNRGRTPNRFALSASCLFGDAGAAVLLEKREGAAPLIFSTCTDGGGFRTIMDSDHEWRHPLLDIDRIMDGVEVFQFSTSRAPEMIREYLARRGETTEDYDRLVLHQANLMIMKQIAKKTGFPMDKLSVSIDEFGNTSSASIPSAIVKEYGPLDVCRTVRLLACGFGVGLTWATVGLELRTDRILPLVHTDSHFDDGLPEE